MNKIKQEIADSITAIMLLAKQVYEDAVAAGFTQKQAMELAAAFMVAFITPRKG